MSLTIRAAHRENGMFSTNERVASQNQADGENKGRKTLFAGDLAMKPDSIAMKREQARKRALKIVGDVFDRDKKFDDALNTMENRKQELQAEAGECKADLEAIQKEREAYADVCGGKHSEEEQQELELLRKERDDQKMQRTVPGYQSQLTEEELADLEKIHAKGLTDYQKGMMELDELDAREKANNQKIAANQNAVLSISQAMGDMVVESLKENPMLEASKEAEAIMEAANKDILGDLIAEGKEHIEEKIEEEKKKAEEKEEEKEEEEEKVEKREEREALQEEMIEKARADAEGREAQVEHQKKKHAQDGPEVSASDIEKITAYNAEKPTTDRELEDLLSKLKLIEDDLKGALVDTDI